jgi:hypothetical protein
VVHVAGRPCLLHYLILRLHLIFYSFSVSCSLDNPSLTTKKHHKPHPNTLYTMADCGVGFFPICIQCGTGQSSRCSKRRRSTDLTQIRIRVTSRSSVQRSALWLAFAWQ